MNDSFLENLTSEERRELMRVKYSAIEKMRQDRELNAKELSILPSDFFCSEPGCPTCLAIQFGAFEIGHIIPGTEAKENE